MVVVLRYWYLGCVRYPLASGNCFMPYGISSRYWVHYQDVSWLGNFLLKDKFNRLYWLDINQNANIIDRVRWEGGNTHMSCWGREDWMWSWGNDGMFSVSRLTDILVELLIWRARHKRLPTRVELDKKGMDLGTIRCPVCDDGIKTVDHSFILCKFALEAWKRVFGWWNMGNFNNLSINEAFMGEGSSFSTKIEMKLWQATEWVTGYMIWKNKNTRTFMKSKPNYDMVFKEIQLKSFEWLSNRLKDRALEWDPWLANPMIYDSNAFSSRRSGIG
ncbi:uncharacterized protein [Rutidosis leptorrhynchoides]|uniref:uncharacterized protein n=1 Tax=Rutidosis leptorrhynchoides TaxID=125765 RepID=UPI003A9976D3